MAKRGICSDCYREFELRNDGMIRHHNYQASDHGVCDGAGKPPKRRPAPTPEVEAGERETWHALTDRVLSTHHLATADEYDYCGGCGKEYEYNSAERHPEHIRDEIWRAMHTFPAPSQSPQGSELGDGAVEALARLLYEASADLCCDASWEDMCDLGQDSLYRTQARAVLAAGYRKVVEP